MNKKKILIIGDNQQEKAIQLGYNEQQIVVVDSGTPLYDIRHLIADNPNIKTILSPTFASLSTSFKELDDFVAFCLLNRINIIIEHHNMSLFEIDDNGEIKIDKHGNDVISIPFKTRLLIETDFTTFN